jgi:hypothetical protein
VFSHQASAAGKMTQQGLSRNNHFSLPTILYIFFLSAFLWQNKENIIL